MKHIFLYLLVGVVAIGMVTGCDNSTTHPVENNPGGEQVDSSFAVFSTERDTLYWGEIGLLRGRGFGTDKDLLQLFVHTHPFTILSITDTQIVFSVPPNSQSGRIRLHRGALNADGEIRLTVIEQSIEVLPDPFDFHPKHGYPNELFTVTGNNLVQRLSDIDVFIGGQKLHIDSMYQSGILARIPEDVKSGGVTIRARSFSRSLGEFTRLEHAGLKQFKQAFKSVSIYVDRMVVFNSFNPDSTKVGRVMWELREEFTALLDGTSIRTEGDSLFCNATRIDEDTTALDLRLKFDPVTSRLSGRVSVHYAYRSNANYVTSLTELELDRSTIRDKDGQLLVEALIPEPANGVRISDMRRTFATVSDTSFMRFESVDEHRGAMALRFVKQ